MYNLFNPNFVLHTYSRTRVRSLHLALLSLYSNHYELLPSLPTFFLLTRTPSPLLTTCGAGHGRETGIQIDKEPKTNIGTMTDNDKDKDRGRGRIVLCLCLYHVRSYTCDFSNPTISPNDRPQRTIDSQFHVRLQGATAAATAGATRATPVPTATLAKLAHLARAS